MSQNDEIMALVGELRRAVSGDEVGLILKKMNLLIFPETEARIEALGRAARAGEYFVMSGGDSVVLGVSESAKIGSLRTLSIEKAEALIDQLTAAVAAAKVYVKERP